jgi:hypothetical protein
VRRRAALFVWLSCAAPAAAEIELTALLEPAEIGLDDVAVFAIEARGLGLSHLSFRHRFELENLEIVGGPNNWEDIAFVNGELSHSLRVAWQLRPKATGPARVYDVSIQLRGERLALPDRSIRVVAPGTLGNTAPARPLERRMFGEPLDSSGHLFGRPGKPWGAWARRAPRVFVTTEVEPVAPVEGQQVTLTVYLHTDVDLSAISSGPLPAPPGFWVRELPVPLNMAPEMVEVDGRRVGRTPLLRKALFPLRAGRFIVAPVKVEVLAERPGLRIFARPPQRLELQSAPIVLDVEALPPAPPGFCGCVGKLVAASRLEPARVRLGEAATLTLTLRGDGNLQSLAVPEIPLPPGLSLTKPFSETRETLAGAKVETHRTLRFAIIPARAGHYEIALPPVAYYDPRQGGFRHAVAGGPLALEVLPRPAPALGGGGDPALPHGVRRTLAPDAPAQRLTEALPRLLPWLFAVPWVLGLVLVLARRGGARRGQPAPAPGCRLKEQLTALPAGLSAKAAAGAIERAWRDFLAARWGVEPGLAPHRWAGELFRRGAGRPQADAVARLVQDLELLRHGPQLAASACLCQEIVAASLRLARALQ